MIVELISVGTEILLGNIVNTNSKYIAEKCALLGFSLFHQVAVGDNEERLKQIFDTAYNRSDIVILTGGLGPTKDDLTKEVVASAMGLSLVSDVATLSFLKDFFSKGRYKDMPESNLKQAMIPEGAIVLKNDNGTAPGIIIENKGKTVVFTNGCFDILHVGHLKTLRQAKSFGDVLQHTSKCLDIGPSFMYAPRRVVYKDFDQYWEMIL